MSSTELGRNRKPRNLQPITRTKPAADTIHTSPVVAIHLILSIRFPLLVFLSIVIATVMSYILQVSSTGQGSTPSSSSSSSDTKSKQESTAKESSDGKPNKTNEGKPKSVESKSGSETTASPPSPASTSSSITTTAAATTATKVIDPPGDLQSTETVPHDSHSHDGTDHTDLDPPVKPQDFIKDWKAYALSASPDDPPFGAPWEIYETDPSHTISHWMKDAIALGDTQAIQFRLMAMHVSGDDAASATKLHKEASALKAAGNYESAAETYTKAIQANQPTAQLYYDRAEALFELYNVKAAENDCTASLEIDPDFLPSLRLRGSIRSLLRMFRGAVMDLTRAQSIERHDEIGNELRRVTVEYKKVYGADKPKPNRKNSRKKKKNQSARKKKRDARIDAVIARANVVNSMPDVPIDDTLSEPMHDHHHHEHHHHHSHDHHHHGHDHHGEKKDDNSPLSSMGLSREMMDMLLADPAIASGLKNPKVVDALSQLMSSPESLMADPARMKALMADPETGPNLLRIMKKLGMVGDKDDTNSGQNNNGDTNVPLVL